MKKILLFSLVFFFLNNSDFLYSRDYKKTEDIIRSILADESGEKGAAETDIAEKTEETPAEQKETPERDNRRRPPSTPGRDAIILKNGIQLYNSGMTESALSAFNDLLSNYSGSPFADSARIWAGRINLQRNNYDEALTLFNSVNQNSGEYPASLFYTGEAMRYKGDLDRAIEIHKRLYNTFPDNEFSDKSLLIAGKLYLRQNRGYQALETAISIIKNHAERDTVDDAYYLMAKIYERDPVLKDIETARRIYKTFLNKASSGDKNFTNSPLLPVVKKDLENLERTYFRLEK